MRQPPLPSDDDAMTDDLVLRYDQQSLVILAPDKEWVFAADPLGRIAWVHTPETTYRRSRFNQWYTVRRDRWSHLVPMEPERLPELVDTWRPTFRVAAERAGGSSAGRAAGSASLAGVLERWIEGFSEFHRMDAERFGSIYDSIPILPPEAYQALYVQLSLGCPWNRCLFCGFYRDRRYRVRDENDLTRHLSSVREYWEGALGSRTGIFLGDANALALPTDVLEDRCRRVRRVFPEARFAMLQSFSDFFTARRDRPPDFMSLHRLGLARISLGVESGCADLLKDVEKPLRHEDILRVVLRAREGGIRVSLIFIIGLGGTRYRDAHFQSSMDLVSRLPLGRPDRIYLSPLVLDREPGYIEIAERHRWGFLNQEEIAVEMSRWGDAIGRIHPKPSVSLYNIRQFAY